MTQAELKFFRSLHYLYAFSWLLAIIFPPVLSRDAHAQRIGDLAVQGYITSVHAPTGFEVDGQQVLLGPDTSFGIAATKGPHMDNSLRDGVHVGVYVLVFGSADSHTRSVTAQTVLFRDDFNKMLSGLGVIENVISKGPAPVFEADGYRILVTSATEVKLTGTLKTLADVGANVWLRYEGKRDGSGSLVASRAEFITAKYTRAKAIEDVAVYGSNAKPGAAAAQQTVMPGQESLIDANGNLVSVRTKVRLNQAGGPCGWHKVPPDELLQERVRRVGLRVVPSYQNSLKSDDPARIPFRFYAIDDAQARSELSCSEGLILVPIQVVDRLKKDDQLAAVLADGVAFSLQWQESRLFIGATHIFLGGDPPLYMGLGVSGYATGALMLHELNKSLVEQRERLALSLMADAGYDPWQSPEAWRLVVPKSLPKDLSSLKYPTRSGYQLGILNMQYRGEVGKSVAGENQ
jgi:Domain of unknown function (DUF5666)